MVDVNLVLTIVALILSIIAGYLGFNYRTQFQDLLGKTKLGLGHFQTGLSEVSNILNHVQNVLGILALAAEGEPMTADNIDDMQASLNAMLASGRVLFSLMQLIIAAVGQIGKKTENDNIGVP